MVHVTDSLDLDLGRRSRRLRVDTLVRLRWLAVVGQATALLVTHAWLGFPFPLGACLIATAASAVLNIGLRLRFGRIDRLESGAASATFAYDILQLSVLLYLTGGIENPFAMLFLAPVMISAVSLPGLVTLGLTVLTVAAATVLTLFHYPLPWYPGQTLLLPFVYSFGIWIAIVLGTAFIATYAWRVAEETRKLADALTATELVLAREQHLTQLDGLAAAAAHELGTPLATITLVVRDLEKQLAKDGAMSEDVALLAQEVERCRKILGTLTSLGDSSGNILDEMGLGLLLEEVVGPQRDFGVKITVVKDGVGREPSCQRNPAILYGLGNLVENAIDFANAEVKITARWSPLSVSILIEDDGPGFSPDVVLRVGEPYVTTRADRRAKAGDGGLGLGLFIAKTLLERSGASVATSNAAPPDHGAKVAISWQRSLFERRRGGAIAPAARAAQTGVRTA